MVLGSQLRRLAVLPGEQRDQLAPEPLDVIRGWLRVRASQWDRVGAGGGQRADALRALFGRPDHHAEPVDPLVADRLAVLDAQTERVDVRPAAPEVPGGDLAHRPARSRAVG